MDREQAGSGGGLALGSSELCSWGHLLEVPITSGTPSQGPPVLQLVSQLSEVITPPALAASADSRAGEQAKTINYLVSALSLLSVSTS